MQSEISRGTSDFLFVFTNNSRLKMSAYDIGAVNEWIEVNAERLKFMHVGETLTIFMRGKAIMWHQATREQFVQSLEK